MVFTTTGAAGLLKVDNKAGAIFPPRNSPFTYTGVDRITTSNGGRSILQLPRTYWRSSSGL